jgi:hypothetical protein
MKSTRFLLIPVSTLRAVEAFLVGRGTAPLYDAAEERRAAELVVRAVCCCELLAAFAVGLAGRPSRN